MLPTQSMRSFGMPSLRRFSSASGEGVHSRSASWSGQFHANVAGSYRLRIDSDDGHRLYVNGVIASDRLPDPAPGPRDVDVTFIAGWNDLVLDYNELTGGASLALTVEDGPEPGLDGVLPASRLTNMPVPA